MTRLRIAHVASWLSRRGAGVKSVVEHLTRSQQELGDEVRVWGAADEAWDSGDNTLWTGAQAEVLRVRGPKSFGYMPGLLRQLHRFNPDIVHLHGLWMYGGLAVLKWHLATGRPYCCSTHGMLSPVSLEFSALKKQVAGAVFQRRVLAGAALIHVTSKEEGEDVRRYGAGNPQLQTRLGIEMPNLATGSGISDPLRKNRVLFLGRLHPQKGLPDLIVAWNVLAREFHDWDLVIAGPDENRHRAELEQQISTGDIPRVRFAGPIYGTERDDLMREAALLVLPSRNENFGLVIAESLAMGTPAVVSKGAPWSEIAGRDCGWWVDRSVDALIQGLREAMSLPPQARWQMGENGRRWMSCEFSWPAVARQISDHYRRLLAGRADAPEPIFDDAGV